MGERQRKDWIKRQIGRIAYRHEGENWNAYYALPDTMKGALYLGSIRMGLITQNDAIKNAFIAVMREAVGELMKQAGLPGAEWREPIAAPEHERAGHS